MTQIERATGTGESGDQAYIGEWMRARWITVVALLGLALQLWWRAGLLGKFYFRQDDFSLLDGARTARFDQLYLFSPVNGQISPGTRVTAWLEARLSFYSWPLASAGTLLLLGLAGLACYWMLRSLFGDRPAILLPFALYLVTPLLVPELTWWSAALRWLPLQVAIFAAVAAHVRYLRTGRLRYVIVATLSIVIGEFFLVKGVLIPLLLFALTFALLEPGGSLAAIRGATRSYWKAWLAYAVVAIGYVVILIVQFIRFGVGPGRLPSASSIAEFGSGLLRLSLIPGLLGGPWKWRPLVGYAVASPPAVLVAASLLVMVLVVVISALVRTRAWRAWAVILAWFIIADIGSALLSPYDSIISSISARDFNFIADAVPVLVICASLAFLPVVGEANPYRAQLSGRPTRVALAMNLVAVVIVGGLWSAHAFAAAVGGGSARSYIATAGLALRRAPTGSQIVSTPVPSPVMDPAFFGDASYTAAVLGPLAPKAARIGWTRSPSGPIGKLLIFDTEGRLWPAIVSGVPAAAPPGNRACWPLGPGLLQLRLQHALYKWSWFIQLGYSGPTTTVAVKFGGRWHDLVIHSGRRDVVLPAPGKGDAVTLQNAGLGAGACVRYVTVGTMQASAYGQPMPAAPAPG